MNRIYKVIWSKVKNCYIVVSEIAKSHSKPISTKLNSGKTVAAVLAVAALCAGMTTSVMAADQYYSVNDMNGALSQFGNKNNDGAQGVGSVAAGAGAKVESASDSFQGAMATVVGSLNTIAAGTQTVVPFDGVANSIVGVANATQNSNATLIFGAGNAVTNSYGNVTLDPGSINPADPVGTARTLGAAVGDSGGQMLVIGGANSADYARFSAITGVSNSLTGKDGNTSDYNFITGAKNTLSNTDSTYVIGSNNTVSDGTSNVVIGDKRKLTSTTGNVVIGSADKEMETTVSNATILGHNANATVADGVALGSNSVASVAKGVVGTVPTGTTVSDTDKASATWTSTLGAVSVGVIGSDGTATATRQITGVAAGKQATDAVNVAQLNAVNTKVDANALHFVQINQGTSGTNYNNDGAKGTTNSIAIGKASTAGNDSIIIGQGAISKSGNTTSYPIRSGDIAIGMGVKVNNYVNQGGGIAIGYNARSENMAGQQERLLALGQTEYTTGIAIGRNSFARSGSTMVGTHNYSGAIGDVTINTAPESMLQPNLNPFATTVGANSFSSGTMSTVTGVYSIATSDYKGIGFSIDKIAEYYADVAKAPKNFGATITGSLNSIESATATSNSAGIANSIVGVANRAANANGALIFGAGNEITNSVTDITVPTSSTVTSAKDLQTRMISAIKASNSAGSTMAMGGGNKADYTQLTSIMGVNNTVTGTSDDISYYNYVSGFNNTATNTDNVTITGTNRTVSGANNTIVIGSADDTIETTASDAVAVGRNSNVTVDGGVALGTSSVASVDKGAIGYDQSGKITDVPYDKEKYQSLQTQISETQDSISTLTSEATVLQSNLDQLKSWYPDSYEQMEAYQGNLAQLTAKQNEIAEAQATLATQESELGAVLQTASTWQATAAAVSVGDVSKGITRQITGVAAGTEDTDAVNVAQLKAAKVEVVGSGDNVTVTSDNSEGYTKYTVAATDTKVTGLTLADNTLTLTQNGLKDLTVDGIATTADLAANKVKYFSVNSTVTENQDNKGAKGLNSIAIGPNAVAQRENGIALGTNVYSGGKGSIVIGSDAKVLENIALDGSIVIGKGATAFTGGGEQEAKLGFDPTNWSKGGSGGYDNPTDASRVATSIVIGTNASGRTGSIDIGDRVYKGTMGGKQITDKNSSFHVNQTTLGTNTYNKGLFSTMVGSYSIATGGFDGGGGLNTAAYGAQNFGATVMGSLNSIRSNGSGSFLSPSYQGIANTIVGLGNITDNSNGSLVFGAGNKITNSITSISMPTSGADSVDAMVDKLQTTIKRSNSGGATLAIGGGNTADYTRASSIIGVNNTLTGTSSNISQNNALTGYNNTATNVDNVTVTGSNNTVTDTTKAVVIGDNRTLTGVNNNVVIGSADSALETTVSDAVAIGRNANVTIEGGAALGANSVARTDKGVVGYDPSGRITDADSILGSNTQYQSLQTEVNDAQTTVNTLNSEAAVLQGYMDQIKQIDSNGYEQQEAYQAFKAQYDAKQTEITAAQADLDSKQSALAEAGKALYTWQSTAGSVSVGDVSKGITRQITDVAAGTADTDAVNVAQLKANKVTVAAGDNVTVTPTTADDGSTTYTVASTDTNTVLESGKIAYNDKGTDGTITLTDSANNKVTVEGVKNTYLTKASLSGNTLTLTQNEGDPLTVTGLATTSQVEANKIHYFHVNSAANGTNYNNNGAGGTDSIAIGQASTNASNSIVMGTGAKMNSYVNQPGGIAIGANSFVENMSGGLERTFDFGQAGYDDFFGVPTGSPKDPSKMTTGVAIGQNTYARSGAIMLGTHNYKGALGDVTVDSTDSKTPNMTIFSTTLGANSYSNGLFSTLTGAYSIASSNYSGGTANATKNFGATVNGAFNSIESSTSNNSSSGIGNSVVGLANRTANSNGALIFGAGNEITNSVTNISVPTLSAPDSAKGMQTLLMNSIKSSNSGGSTLAIGGGNKADYTQQSALIGVNNTLTGTSGNISQYNYITGFKNTGTNVDNVTIIGTNRTVSDAANSVVIGSANSAMTSSASDAVTIGRNANTTIDGGVALGSSSVASVDKGVAGYDVTTGKASDATSATWKSTLAAVSVGVPTDGDAATATRQITGVAAGMQETDAVNVAQLKQVAEVAENAGKTTLKFTGDDVSEDATIARSNGQTLNIIGGAKATDADGNSLLTDNNIGVVKEGDNALKVKLAKDLTMADGSISFNNGVKLSSAGLDNGNQTITNVAAGVNATDAVNVSQLNANKVTVVQGENVTVTPSTTANGTTYTVAAKDTYTESGTYDATSKKIKFVQNDTDKNYEVDLSNIVDSIDSVSGKHTAITLNEKAPTAGANGALGSYIGDSNLTMAVKDINGQKVYDLKMSKDLVAGTKPGEDGKNGEAGSITIIGEPGSAGADGKNASANIIVKDGSNGLDGKDGFTRVVYTDEDGTPHEVATLDDGLNFTGDTAGVTVAKKLNSTLSITGGITDATKLSDNNIGVVAKADGGLTVKLAKDLAMTDGSISFNNGVKLSSAGLDNGNQKITNVAAGTADTDAVNVSQLNSALKGAKHTEVTLNGDAPTAGKDGALGSYIGDSNLTMAVKDVDGQKVYDLKMSKDLVAGTKPGADGKDGEAGSITIIGEPGKDGTDGKNTSANITVKDGKNGLDGTDGITRIVYKDEDGTDHEIATMDDGLNFTGDTAGVTVAKKLNETLSITGGITDADQLTTEDNIGVVASNSGLKVRLAKDLQDLNSVRIGGTTTNKEGIYIANQDVTSTKDGVTLDKGNYITGLENTTWDPTNKGYVSGRAATEDQLNSVYDTINKNIEANKVTGGKNITVDKDNKVSLKDNITLGGDTAANQVNINGDAATITAGDGANKVVVDGTNGQVTIGEAGKGLVLGNQTVEGTKTDNGKDSQSGKFLTGLDNTTWDPANKGIVADRAATEGQLKNVADNISKQISDIDTAVKSTSRVFESDSGADAQVTRKSTDPMKLKGGADANNLSDGNIGVVNNSDNTGFDIKLSKDIKGLNSIEVNNKITIGTGDNQTIIEGDTINTGSVTTGNTTINNEGLTIVNEDSSKNITINNNNVNMGGNVIKNIGEGSEPTDAINKTQFDRAINNLGTGMNQINNRVNKLDNRVNRVGAGAAALAALHPLEFSPDAKWEVTAGVGNYRGANAIALGAFYRPNFDTMFSIGTSYGGGENMINAGVTWRIGEGETKAYPSKTVMAQEIDDLKNVVSEQQDQIEELKKLVNSLINK